MHIFAIVLFCFGVFSSFWIGFVAWNTQETKRAVAFFPMTILLASAVAEYLSKG